MLLQTTRECAIIESNKLKNKDQPIYIDWCEDEDYCLSETPSSDSHFVYVNGIEQDIDEEFNDCPF